MLAQKNPSPSFGDKVKNFLRQHRVYGAILGVLLLTVSTAIFFTYQVYIAHPKHKELKVVEIPVGFGFREIGGKLKDEGVVKSKWMFVLYISLQGQASFLKPGIYELPPSSIHVVAKTLVEGINREQVITIPEGFTIKDISRILQDKGIVAGASFEAFAARHPAATLKEQFPFLKEVPQRAGLEGYLFPDTYRFFSEATPLAIAQTLLKNFQKKVSPELQELAYRKQKKLYEVVTMASLIEKEVVSDHDRRIVSGVLWKRLAHNIPLQVDATVSYIKRQRSIGNGKQAFISLEDTKIDSPYNTYTYIGLPVAPIGNPGLSTIQAALEPTASSYWYYLSAPDGRTIFSETLQQHNRAKAKYLHP